MEFKFRNVNDAFRALVSGIHSGEIPTNRLPSRNGEVLKIPEPVTICYERPRERVLFNRARDCNPYFHLYESLWMLAGRNEVKSVAYYASNIRNYSDDGETLHGAYGYRWRKWFGYDQLELIARELRDNPNSRRCVLAMWDGGTSGYNLSDLGMLAAGGKDIPCNTHAYFSIRRALQSEGEVCEQGEDLPCLDMTVCNRSNDLIWGALGANVVHFSFLLEYLAARIGVEVGKYYQFTNNLHVYTDNWKPEEWLADDTPDFYESSSGYQPAVNPQLLIENPKTFEAELPRFVERHGTVSAIHEPFLKSSSSMLEAFYQHKQRNYELALAKIANVRGDWRIAGENWLEKRRVGWERKQKEKVQ